MKTHRLTPRQRSAAAAGAHHTQRDKQTREKDIHGEPFAMKTSPLPACRTAAHAPLAGGGDGDVEGRWRPRVVAVGAEREVITAPPPSPESGARRERHACDEGGGGGEWVGRVLQGWAKVAAAAGGVRRRGARRGGPAETPRTQASHHRVDRGARSSGPCRRWCGDTGCGVDLLATDEREFKELRLSRQKSITCRTH